MTWAAEAPSNIALIKYMGKKVGEGRNYATNSSLSYTLDALRTRVEIEETHKAQDHWEPFPRDSTKPVSNHSNQWVSPSLAESSVNRFLIHFKFLKQKLGVSGHYRISSANNFPSDCGLASSASSFAALTMATYEMAKSMSPDLDMDLSEVSELSRVGSGSSIRSFYGPWCLWSAEGASEVSINPNKLLHNVIVIEGSKKKVSSSEAHQRVPTSYIFQGRTERAEKRLQELQSSLIAGEWKLSYQITWEEFFDMHALFETSRPAFGYLTPKSFEVLRWIQNKWEQENDGPLVTMDAGPNIHLLFREDQRLLQDHYKKQLLELKEGELDVI